MYLNYGYEIDDDKIRDGAVLQIYNYEHYYPVLILTFDTTTQGQLYVTYNGESKILKFELQEEKHKLTIFEENGSYEVDIVDAIDPEEWEIVVTKKGE